MSFPVGRCAVSILDARLLEFESSSFFFFNCFLLFDVCRVEFESSGPKMANLHPKLMKLN